MSGMVKNKAKKFRRGSGTLLHISSLPSSYGIGDFGPGACRFVDFLATAGQTYWQILPLSPTMSVYGNSPYSSDSAFAINPLFVSPDLFVQEGWLTEDDLSPVPAWPDNRVHYEAVEQYKSAVLHKVFARFKETGLEQAAYRSFCCENAAWLDPYAEFEVLKEHFAGQVWSQWPEELRTRQPEALNDVRAEFQDELERIKLWQFLAWKQWSSLKNYCLKKGVSLIGDIPIYVNYDSSDVWSNPHIFQLDANAVPVYVAGVPPDYFSKTGQRWGNPVYNWDALQQDRFRWWVERVRHMLKFFDVIRIDHFRGLVAFWRIPAQEKTAINGEWVPVPTDAFFETLAREFPGISIIAEDLGIITDDVKEKMQALGFPGMKVLIFAFGEDIEIHPYIPENYSDRCVAYTGTHDNNTVQGWYLEDAGRKEKENLKKYFSEIDEKQLHWQMIGAVMRSKADLAIFPLQDFLGLGPEGRMNVPGTSSGNWTWRVSPEYLTPELADLIFQYVQSSHRTPVPLR